MVALTGDVLLLVFSHLDPGAIRVIKQTCRMFLEVSRWRSLWDTLIEKHITDKSIPIPGLKGRALSDLTTKEVELALHRALRLRSNWTSPCPEIRRSCTFVAAPGARVIRLYFLPGQSWRWLISLTLARNPRLYTLQTWDMLAFPPVCIGRKEFSHLRDVSVNRVSVDNVIAILSGSRLEVLRPNLVSTNVVEEPSMRLIHYFCDKYLLCRESGYKVVLHDLSDDTFVELQNPDLPSQTDDVSDAHQIHDVTVSNGTILIFRRTTLEMYTIPPAMGSNHTGQVLPSIVRPTQVFNWPWRIDHGAMTVRNQPTNASTSVAPVSILIRFGSIYPWPVNLLHQYELTADRSFDSKAPINSLNCPFKFPPTLLETVAAPIRLDAFPHMALGPYGSAIWTDSHTQEYFAFEDQGQRLAGRLFQQHESSHVVVKGPMPSDIHEAEETAIATSVFAYQQTDSWVNIALDEVEGIVALGHEGGEITLLSYA